MKLTALKFAAVSSALVINTSYAVTIYDNLNNGAGSGDASFSSGAGFPDSRALVGEDLSTLSPTVAGDTWQVDSIDLTLIVFGDNSGIESTFSDVTVEVTFFAQVTGTGTGTVLGGNLAASFGIAPILGSETFTIGELTTSNSGADTINDVTLNFTEVINIGDGQNIGVTFGFNDTTDIDQNGGLLARNGGLGLSYRFGGDSVAPAIGTTSDRNFLDGDGDGEISSFNDSFAFSADLGGRFSIDATAVSIPEPTSLSLLALMGLGAIARRRR